MLTFTYLAVYRKYFMRAELPCFWGTLAKHYMLKGNWIPIIGTMFSFLLLLLVGYVELIRNKLLEPSQEIKVVSLAVSCGLFIITGTIYSILRIPGKDLETNNWPEFGLVDIFKMNNYDLTYIIGHSVGHYFIYFIRYNNIQFSLIGDHILVRQKYNEDMKAPETWCSSCCLMCFCDSCAAGQMGKSLEMRGVHIV